MTTMAIMRPMPGPDSTPGSTPESGSGADLFAVLETELHGIAQRMLRSERSNHTLQPTALMHEAWLKLANVHEPWRDRAHFVRTAARAMRRVLVEHGRARLRDKRGGGASPVTLSTDIHGDAARPDDVVAVDEALQSLAAFDPELEQIVELRVFGGLDLPEVATVMNCSLRTVERGWRTARAVLRRTLGGGDAT
jgi:RNA polymerase sigma-70 factor, ECF subfamily